jgi:uncharacterized membrane protein (UPF0127 family)
MKYVTLTNLDQPDTPTLILRYCKSFFCQLRGLMFVRRLEKNTGLLLVQPRDSRLEASIHMFFMRIDLAVIWINHELEVVDTCLAKRWHPAYFPRRPACYVLETDPEQLKHYKPGDKVSIHEAWLD